MKITSNRIEDFPFQKFAEINQTEIESLAKEMTLVNFNSWMLPQIQAYYGKWQLAWVEGKVDCQETAKLNIQDNWSLGLWRVVTKLKRGSLVKQQISPDSVNYSALVPIILMGIKRFQGINYSSWRIDENCKLIHDALLEAMLYDVTELKKLSRERILEIREQGLTVKSGANQGKKLSSTSTWTLKGIQNTEFKDVPNYVVTMLSQIWVAHPQLRTNLMVLDPESWDTMPDPLISEDIFHKPKKTLQIKDPHKIDMPF